MLLEEIVYNNRDNAIALRLSSDGVAISHTAITRCQVLVGTILLDSSATPAFFDLTKTDRLILKLGSAGLTTGRHQATLFVYDVGHPNGIVWDSLVITVK